MNLVTWVILGIITALAIKVFDPHHLKPQIKKEAFTSMGVSILGALSGGTLANLVLEIPINDYHVISFLLAVVGSLVVLFSKQIYLKA